MAESFYDVLGVPKTAPDDEIRNAYRKLAKKYHPDLNQGDETAANMFKKINEAYETLSDPQKKAAYDQGFAGSFSGDPGAGGGAGFGAGFGAGARPGAGGAGAGASFFDDFVNMFNGDVKEAGGGGDISLNVTLTFEEAAYGVQKDISVNRFEPCAACRGTGARGGTQYAKCNACGGTGKVRFAQETPFGRVVSMKSCSACSGTGKIIKEPCPACNGHGIVRKNVNLRITFPAGIEHGQIMTVPGEGERGKHSARPGNLVLMINVMPHKLFKRKGLDLSVEVPITFTQAILGDKIMIPMLRGSKVAFPLPEGTQNGTVFKLKGQGVENVKKGITGDLLVTVDIEMPKNLTKEQKAKIRELGDLIKSDQYENAKGFAQAGGGPKK
ncbi:MAG: molecular chaperone DnaJ [Clostridiales bacterium]|jgi:molecular chaperone DnaJ|nr:molecular chaperone DnaJ [Clostridiales bacterium]